MVAEYFGNRSSEHDLAEIEEICITRDSFLDLIDKPDFRDLLEKADIETAMKSDVFDVLDVDMGGELCFGELVIAPT